MEAHKKEFWIVDEDGDVEHLLFTPNSTRQEDWSYSFKDGGLQLYEGCHWEYGDRDECYYFTDKEALITDHHEIIVNNSKYVAIISKLLQDRRRELDILKQKRVEISRKIDHFRDETFKILLELTTQKELTK